MLRYATYQSNRVANMILITDLRNFLKNNSWVFICELVFLSLMVISLPSLEAPKNIFGALFITTSIYRQLKNKTLGRWGLWDTVFLCLIISACLSAMFAGIPNGSEWKGFRGILAWTTFGWLISRSSYSRAQIEYIYLLSILATIPPLIWGMIEYKLLKTTPYLQLNSVGHVNHSAIYLTMIFGAALGLAINSFNNNKPSLKVLLIPLAILFYISIIISQSRAAFGISTLIGISLIALMLNQKKNKVKAIVILVSIICGMFITDANIVEKQINNQKTNNVLASRDVIQNTSIVGFKAYPIFGVGNGNWGMIDRELIKKTLMLSNKKYKANEYMVKSDAKTAAPHPHSLYFSALTERGIVGFIAITFLMLAWLKILISDYKLSTLNHDNFGHIWAGSFAAWAATFGIGFANSTFHHEHALLALLFLGLHVSLANERCRRPNNIGANIS